MYILYKYIHIYIYIERERTFGERDGGVIREVVCLEIEHC
jgi:hypothetical protein